jgi:hypothetical protein
MSRIGVFDRETGLTHYLAIKPDNTLSLEYLQCSFPGATGIYTRGDDPDSIFPLVADNQMVILSFSLYLGFQWRTSVYSAIGMSILFTIHYIQVI